MKYHMKDNEFVKYLRNHWPPFCWIWAHNQEGGFAVIGKRYTSQTMIDYHTRNKRHCPFCVYLDRTRPEAPRSKW